VRLALAFRAVPLNQVYNEMFLPLAVIWQQPGDSQSGAVGCLEKQAADLLGLLFVVEMISPAVQFLGEPAQHAFSISPGLWNDVSLDVIDGAFYLGFRSTGSLPKGLGYSPFLTHRG